MGFARADVNIPFSPAVTDFNDKRTERKHEIRDLLHSLIYLRKIIIRDKIVLTTTLFPMYCLPCLSHDRYNYCRFILRLPWTVNSLVK